MVSSNAFSFMIVPFSRVPSGTSSSKKRSIFALLLLPSPITTCMLLLDKNTLTDMFPPNSLYFDQPAPIAA